jgi:TolB-like protein/class 3 adenylate cyclase/cytochrome c-type biogenesis protein CcmH/NrfG
MACAVFTPDGQLMTEERVRRRLAAILVADVVGYGRLMEQDEAGTLAALKERRRTILSPLVAQHQGRIVKVLGDGVIVEFASAVNAVECALELQQAMTDANQGVADHRHIMLRIGINLGDVIVEGSDLYGDGVNIAARLEALAEPGGICVSGSVYGQVRRKLRADFEDIGPQTVKNIADPVHVYRIDAASPATHSHRNTEHAALALPTAPSIAILPFTNMSSDPEHEFFADGLTEDLITDLSQVAGLFVIARNSSFAYKGKSTDVRSIARNLGVRYVLEGSARRAAGRVRINVQLVDAIAGGHIWAERFDRGLEDVFSVQDEVTARIIEALIGRLTTRIPDRKKPANMEAYDLFVRARALFFQFQSPRDTREQRLLLERAVSLEPEFVEAHCLLAVSYSAGWLFGGELKEPNLKLAVAAVQKAFALDPSDAGARWVNARLLTVQGRFDEAEAEFAVALELDPNNADAWAMLSDLIVYRGRPTEALDDIQKALRLNPHPPGWYYWLLGQAQYLDRQYERAVQSLRREETYRTPSRRTLAASLAQLGRLDEAQREAAMFMVSNQHFTIRNWLESQPFDDQAACQHFVDGYRKAGLPE